jgi:hypothetical protein
MVSANINGTIVSCVDQAACDTNSALGQLAIANQTVAGVQVLGAAATSTHSGTQSLNTSSFQLINGNAGTVPLTVLVGDTSYIGPVTLLDLSGGGTFQSAIGSTGTLQYWADTANGQGATTPTTHPGALLATDNKTALLTTDSFAFNHPATAFVDPDLYSMTVGSNFSLVAGGSVVGRTQAIVATPSAVNEPGTLGILGMGLIGAGIVLRLRNKLNPYAAGYAAA